jgi:anti-sigma B factor antagonist
VYRRGPGAVRLSETYEAPEFRVDARREGPVATVAVVGELDIATGPELQAAINALEPGYEELVIDLSECSFFASSGISILLEENARAAREGFRMVVVKAPASAQRIFDLTSLEKLIEFRD